MLAIPTCQTYMYMFAIATVHAPFCSSSVFDVIKLYMYMYVKASIPCTIPIYIPPNLFQAYWIQSTKLCI